MHNFSLGTRAELPPHDKALCQEWQGLQGEAPEVVATTFNEPDMVNRLHDRGIVATRCSRVACHGVCVITFNKLQPENGVGVSKPTNPNSCEYRADVIVLPDQAQLETIANDPLEHSQGS